VHVYENSATEKLPEVYSAFFERNLRSVYSHFPDVTGWKEITRKHSQIAFKMLTATFKALDECCLLGCINMVLRCSFGLALTLVGALVLGNPLCDEARRVKISSWTLKAPNGLEFTKGNYWHHHDGATYGCPCLIKNCLQPCKGSGWPLVKSKNLTLLL
jgi:hypothetical protein